MKSSFLLPILLTMSLTAQAGVIVAAGGGAEGDVGDTSSWSYRLYQHLLLNGDTNGDNVIEVAILTTSLPNKPNDAEWLPNYFEWIGTDLGLNVSAANYEVPDRATAQSNAAVGGVANADVVFIKGGDQGVYYDEWNGTLLETHIRTVVETRGGAIGGTSAGAMSLAEFSFSGSKDMISPDVLADAHTTYLDDASEPGTSGIHNDFFGFVAGVTIETHYTQRGRLGRMLGVLAKASQDFSRGDLLAIGIERDTGIVIENGEARVIGPGSVSFVQQTAATSNLRDPGQPLVYSNLRLDRLTDGWRFDLGAKAPLTNARPSGTSAVNYSNPDQANSGALTIDGAVEADNQKFANVGTFYPDDYSRVPGTESPYVKDAVGYTDAGNSNNRMDKHETLFHLLYDDPTDLGVLVFSGGSLSRDAGNADVLTFSGVATILVDASSAGYKGLSPYASNWAASGGALRAAAFTNLTLHVLADSAGRDLAYNSRTRALTTNPGAGNGGGDGGDGGGSADMSETEPNDSTSGAQDLRNEALPLTIEGFLDISSDLDYFEIELADGESIQAALTVPSGVDYDLYLMDHRGRTVLRSTNDGAGLNESISYTHTDRRARSYYVLVESWSGSSATDAYLLELSN